MDLLERLAALFGGGPQAAYTACITIAAVALFLELRRSNRAHLADARAFGPVAEKAMALIHQAVDILEEATRALERHSDLLAGEQSKGGRPPRPRKPKSPSQVMVPTVPDPDEEGS